MLRSSTFLCALGLCAVSLILIWGCDGAFVGPPQGSTGGTDTSDPLVGASPFTFEPELSSATGFATDVWFFNPGQDSNDSLTGGSVSLGDGLDCLKSANYEEFSNGNQNQQAPCVPEVNLWYPMVMSFQAQMFQRNADGSRFQEVNEFGVLQYSGASQDISLVTGPVEEQRNTQDVLIGKTLPRALYPNGNTLTVKLPLATWRSPQLSEPGSSPPPQEVFAAKQFSEMAGVMVSIIGSGSTSSATALGGAIADSLNVHTEGLGAVPMVNMNNNAWTALSNPTGPFFDSYAAAFTNAPVWKPTDQNVSSPGIISDIFLERSLVEYARHLAAIQSNLVGQAIGLVPQSNSSIMNQEMATLVNRYLYAFTQDDKTAMASKVVGPTDPNDEDLNIGLLPGPNRR